MPRDTTKNQYYHVGIPRKSRVHQMVDTGAAGKTGADFIKMLVEDVDRLIHGEPAVVLSGLLAAKSSLQPFTENTQSMETVPAAPESVVLQAGSIEPSSTCAKVLSHG